MGSRNLFLLSRSWHMLCRKLPSLCNLWSNCWNDWSRRMLLLWLPCFHSLLEYLLALSTKRNYSWKRRYTGRSCKWLPRCILLYLLHCNPTLQYCQRKCNHLSTKINFEIKILWMKYFNTFKYRFNSSFRGNLMVTRIMSISSNKNLK